MKSKYPIKKIRLLNLWLTSYFFLFGFFSTMAKSGWDGLHSAFSTSLIGAFIIIINAFVNLALLVFFEKRNYSDTSKNRIRYLAFSYILSFIVYFVVIYVYSLIFSAKLYFFVFTYIAVICILTNTLILAMQNYITVQDAKMNADIENSHLKIANADAANQLLRQQIHPHFLFNALNILKSLYKIDTKSGEEYLICLSDFLRAAVSNNNIKIATLKDELKLCEDYLKMQRIRFGDALNYSIKISESTLFSGFVPSFSIQPLLENAIKHNELTEESPLHIQISQDGDRICVSNNLQLKVSTETATGSGLSNLSERYKLLANDDLIIKEDKNTFSVSLKIMTHETSLIPITHGQVNQGFSVRSIM